MTVPGLLLTVVSLLAAGCAGAAGHPVAASQHRTTPEPALGGTGLPGATTPGQASPRSSASPHASPTVLSVSPPPARLHQTRAFPSAHSRAFRAEMTDLWAAVVTGQARLARQSFFPLTAYTQVKAIADPAADWHSRLVRDFRLDVAAVHHYLGHGASHTRLLRVIVPSAQAAWINPGVGANGVGYWHVSGARVVYRQHSQIRSIGIASLISWRGRWYVVHFGAVLRNGGYGIVDTPASGPGIPGPPGGC